jgi:xylulose-5-phosphate/fructose-6-phosphate phosphoketolase
MTTAAADVKRKTAEASKTAYFKQATRDKLIEHKHYICKHGDDMPEIAGWRWGQQEKAGGPRVADTGGDNV